MFKQGFLLLETDKHVYYPGESIECSIQLHLREELEHADRITVNIRGKEKFKFNSKSKNHRTLANKRTIVDQTFVLCRFAPSYLPAQDYTVLFRYRIPEQATN